MTTAAPDPAAILRAHAEQDNAAELDALARVDDRQRPPGWRLSPWAVVAYVLGGKLPDGTAIEIFTLRNATGVELKATNYGGIITSLRVPDRAGTLD